MPQKRICNSAAVITVGLCWSLQRDKRREGGRGGRRKQRGVRGVKERAVPHSVNTLFRASRCDCWCDRVLSYWERQVFLRIMNTEWHVWGLGIYFLSRNLTKLLPRNLKPVFFFDEGRKKAPILSNVTSSNALFPWLWTPTTYFTVL